jgi:hypothetical protein
MQHGNNRAICRAVLNYILSSRKAPYTRVLDAMIMLYRAFLIVVNTLMQAKCNISIQTELFHGAD